MNPGLILLILLLGPEENKTFAPAYPAVKIPKGLNDTFKMELMLIASEP